MNKWWFRTLVFLMSLSLIGIISIQFYWFKNTLEGNADQFKLQVKQVLGNVAEHLYEREALFFLDRMNELVQDGVDDNPEQMLEFGYYQRNTQTNETIIYSNTILSEDFMLPLTFFDNRKDSLPFKNFTSKRQLEVYNSLSPDKQKMQNNLQLSDSTTEADQSPDQKSSRIDYTSIQQNTSAVHWSFLNDCEISKIITHLSAMKLNDLKALYDTVSLKLTKRNGYIVEYNPSLTAFLGCHSNALLLGSFEQSKVAPPYVGPYKDKNKTPLGESIDVIYEASEHSKKTKYCKHESIIGSPYLTSCVQQLLS